MAVGSPALITYSLMLTILNRKCARDEFARLHRHLSDVTPKYSTVRDRLRDVEYVLKQSQQVPLRVSQKLGWFSSLIVNGHNHQWWEDLGRDLAFTRRGVNLVLVLQMLAAVIAWAMSVSALFIGDIGDLAAAEQIAAGNVWIWMVRQKRNHTLGVPGTLTALQVPVIWGWLLVGTQAKRRSIDLALTHNTASRASNASQEQLSGTKSEDLSAAKPLCAIMPSSNQPVSTEKSVQRGLVILDRESGLTPYPLRDLKDVFFPHDLSRPPSRLFDLLGDERRRGPLFNYARVFTYRHLIATVRLAQEQTLKRIRSRETVSRERTWDDGNYTTHLEGSEAQTEAYCGLEGRPIWAYPEFGDLDLVWRDIAVASGVAMLVQWGTTGMAVMIAFLTQVMGLGCHSASYLLYGVLATASWFLLASSTMLSHAVMLQFQRVVQKEPLVERRHRAPQDATTDSIPLSPLATAQTHTPSGPPQSQSFPTDSRGAHSGSDHEDPARPPPPLPRGTKALRVAAVLTRWAGKFLAAINALWVVVISLLEVTGGFDNCWCRSNQISLGEAGWIILFRTTEELARTERTPVAVGVAMSVVVCGVSLAVFALARG